MRRLRLFLLSFLAVFMLFGSVGFVIAEEDEDEVTDEEEEDSSDDDSDAGCDCWCKSSDGAQGMDVVADTTSCRTACDDSGYGYSMCTTSGSTPADNDKCWSQYECENNMAEIDGEEVPYEWDDSQATECVSGERYCFRPPEEVELSVVIGEIGEVDSIPDYINAVYNFLLPTASLLAVLVLMVGGLQYMLARGDQGRIGKAKDRIRNAVTGLVILLSVVAMAQIADPSLTNLNRLTPPAIRTVVFIDPDSTCEAMRTAGLTIDADISGQENCGDTGTVSDQGDTETTVQLGDTCPFSGCDNSYEACIGTSQSDTGFDCVRCKDVYETLTTTVGATPSNGICGRLSDDISAEVKDALAASGEYGSEFYCGYFDAAVFSDEFNSCIEYSYPAGEDYLDCDLLHQNAKEDDSEGCRAYDEVRAAYSYEALEAVWNASVASWVYDPNYVNEIDDLQGANGYDLLEDLCNADPCGLAPDGDSCRVFTVDTPWEDISAETIEMLSLDEEIILEAVLIGEDILSLGWAYDSFANCADSGSAYGLYYCKDAGGEYVDCNPTW